MNLGYGVISDEVELAALTVGVPYNTIAFTYYIMTLTHNTMTITYTSRLRRIVTGTNIASKIVMTLTHNITSVTCDTITFTYNLKTVI
jgi:hypothetical protein